MALSAQTLAAAEIRHLKKYPNRRLYDLQESRYVTLAHVCQLVRSGTPIQVVRAQTNRDRLTGNPDARPVDITAEIMLDVVQAQEMAAPRLTLLELRNMIRAGMPL